jgi:hypothetical protein
METENAIIQSKDFPGVEIQKLKQLLEVIVYSRDIEEE